MKTDDREQSGKIGSRTDSDALAGAFRLLARRDHSRRELTLKLEQKGFAPHAIEQALERCCRLGYLDDARTAMSIAGHWVEKGYGRLRVRQVLAQKGIDAALIEKALARCGDENAQVAAARRLLEKQAARAQREIDPCKRRRAAYRRLAGRGFPAEVIWRAINQESAQNHR